MAVIFQETITTRASGDYNSGACSYSGVINYPSLKITFNGVSYDCPKNEVSGPEGPVYLYGGFSSQGPDFTDYPFGLMSDPSLPGNICFTETAGTYTVKVENVENIPLVNKVVFGNETLIDLTSDTVTADKLMQGYTAHDRTGAVITGTATGGGTPTLQNKTVSPSESQQSVQADSGYDGLDTVTVNAISSTYVGSGITRRSSSDLTASGATVTVPSGYYSSQASKAVTSGSAGTPTATKGTVSNHSVSVTPSVTNTTGYITGGTKTGTAVTVSASELVSGSETKTENGTYDVTNLASLVVNIPFVTYYTGSTNPASSLGSNGDIYLKVVS